MRFLNDNNFYRRRFLHLFRIRRVRPQQREGLVGRFERCQRHRRRNGLQQTLGHQQTGPEAAVEVQRFRGRRRRPQGHEIEAGLGCQRRPLVGALAQLVAQLRCLLGRLPRHLGVAELDACQRVGPVSAVTPRYRRSPGRGRIHLRPA